MRGVEMRKTVMITGAASGFGTYAAHAFAHAGYDLVINGRDKTKLLQLQNALSKTGDVQCRTVVADVRNKLGLNALKKALRAYKVSILVNNAGINPELRGTASVRSVDEINDIVLTNMSSAIASCNNAFEYFAEHEGGTVINVNSVAGLKGNYKEAVYSASKFGLRGFSESVKDTWLGQGVRMIDVYSGAMATGMSSKRGDVGSLIDPRELAEFLVTLCTTNSFFVREINVQKTRHARSAKRT